MAQPDTFAMPRRNPAHLAPADAGGKAPERAPAVPAGPGKQLLIYAPDGALGGTFTCTHCRASAVHPALLAHAAGCVYAEPAGR